MVDGFRGRNFLLQAWATIWMVGEVDQGYSQKPPTDFESSQPSMFFSNNQSLKPVGEAPVVRSSKLVIVCRWMIS